VTWSLLAVKVVTLNTHGVCPLSQQAAAHPLTGPHTNKHNTELVVVVIIYSLHTFRCVCMYVYIYIKYVCVFFTKQKGWLGRKCEREGEKLGQQRMSTLKRNVG
jgi:hypothetical protein